MSSENVAGSAVCDGELLTYVGTLRFRGGDKYDMAFFAPLGGDPDFDNWMKFEDRWAIYEAGSIDKNPTDGMECPEAKVLRSAPDEGWGHFAKNKFFGWGPGGMWAGKFVDENGKPAPFHPPTGQFNTHFVGPFWLFGEIDDD